MSQSERTHFDRKIFFMQGQATFNFIFKAKTAALRFGWSKIVYTATAKVTAKAVWRIRGEYHFAHIFSYSKVKNHTNALHLSFTTGMYDNLNNSLKSSSIFYILHKCVCQLFLKLAKEKQGGCLFQAKKIFVGEKAKKKKIFLWPFRDDYSGLSRTSRFRTKREVS